MALALPDNYPIDNAFRLAGFPTGRPMGATPGGRAVGATWALLVELFDDATLNMLIAESATRVVLPPTNEPVPAFDLELAAVVLETCIGARITPLGRLLETTEAVIGNAQMLFDAPERVMAGMQHSIRSLRERAGKSLATRDADTGRPLLPPIVSGQDDYARQLAINADDVAQDVFSIGLEADRKAVAAQGTADTALANAATADGKAVAAQATADTALANAATAQGDIDAHKANHPAGGGGGADAAARARLDAIEADDWVTGRRIAAKTIGSGLLVDNVIDQERLIADDVIDTQHIAANAVTESELHGDVTADIAKGATAERLARAAEAGIEAHRNAIHDRDSTARHAASLAQLAADTDITVGPELVHNSTTAFNLSVAIRHPVNAYPTATLVSVAVGAQPAVLVGYVANDTDQYVIAEIPTTSLTNIWDATDSIDDGRGGTRNVQRYPVGSFVPVEIRLLTGRGGNTVFIRVKDLRVGPA